MSAALKILEDPLDETPDKVPMEARIAKLESDVEHIKDVMDDIKIDVRSIQGGLKAANDAFATLQKEVGIIGATIPHLATKADLGKVEGSLNARINEVEGSLGAKIKEVEGSLTAKIIEVKGSLETRISAMETKIVKWFVFTAVGLASLAFSIARFVS